MTQTALITGASGGIGYEFLPLLAKDGCNLVITARNKEQLEEIARKITAEYKITVTPIAFDLAKSGKADQLCDELEKRGITIDILINNAGFGLYGAFHAADYTRTMEMVELNISALTRITRRLLPGMIARKHGRIMQVASVAAFQPGPFMGVYYATKAFVLSLSEALAEELSGTGVTVTALCPGPVRTNFAKAADFNHSRLFDSWYVASAAEVAAYGYKAMRKGCRVAVHGFGNRLLTLAVRFIPRLLIVKSVRFMQEKTKKG